MIGNKYQKAFTFVESMIVIAMIGILSIVIIPSYQSARNQLALERAAVKLAQDLRKVQEMAMSAQDCEVCPGGGIPEGGYGLYINKNDPLCSDNCYHIYANIAAPWDKYTSSDIILETIFIENGVLMHDLVVPSGNYSVNFTPPDPIVHIKNMAGEDKDNVTMILALASDDSKQKRIDVNVVGLIDID